MPLINKNKRYLDLKKYRLTHGYNVVKRAYPQAELETFKLSSLRDNQGLGNIITDVTGLFGPVGTVINSILGLFGANPGEYKDGVFYPGDWTARLSFANQRISSLGVGGKYNTSVLDALLRVPTGWQALVDNYLGTIANGTGSYVPEVQQVIDAVKAGKSPNLALAGFNTWVIIALVGAGLFLVLGNKKKRGRK